MDRCRSSNLSFSFSSESSQYRGTCANEEHTYSHSSADCVVSVIKSATSSSPSRCKKSSRPSPLKFISSTSSPGLSRRAPFCKISCSPFDACNGFPTMSSRTFNGSVESAGGVICCFRPEPLGSREEFKEVVDQLNFPETFREDERGLKPGLVDAPCPSRFGRRGPGENDLCCGGGEPVGVGFVENLSSHIFDSESMIIGMPSKAGPYYIMSYCSHSLWTKLLSSRAVCQEFVLLVLTQSSVKGLGMHYR